MESTATARPGPVRATAASTLVGLGAHHPLAADVEGGDPGDAGARGLAPHGGDPFQDLRLAAAPERRLAVEPGRPATRASTASSSRSSPSRQ